MAGSEYAEEGEDAEGLLSTQQRNILYEKRARRLAEEDALRLFNRVRQLEKEEEKAEKRIAETQKKAREIVALRERNELKQQQKEARLRELEADIERQKAENLRLKEEIVRARTDAENAVYAEKLNAAQQGKEEHEQILKAVAETRLLTQQEAMEQKDSVRRAQEEGRRRMEQLKISKLQMAQEDYDKRLQGEVEAKGVKEREIEKLAQMELQLIERLKSKQNEQRKAYQQLEAVLSLGSTRSSSGRLKGTGSGTGSANASPSGTLRRAGSSSDKTAPPPPAPPPPPLAATSSNVDEPSEQDVARAFSVYDQEGTGQISSRSVEGLLRDLSMTLNTSQLSQAIGQLDPDGKGSVSFGHFLLWWKG